MTNSHRQSPRYNQPSTHNSSTTSQIIRLSVSSSPLPSCLQLNVLIVAHSALIEVLHLQQIHTQASAKNHNPSLTACLHIPAPTSPHPQFLRLCKSQLTSPTHNLVMPLSHCFHTPVFWLKERINPASLGNETRSSVVGV